MSLHLAFPVSPYALLDPAVRRLPGDGAASPEKLLPPPVTQLRKTSRLPFRNYSQRLQRTKGDFTPEYPPPHPAQSNAPALDARGGARRPGGCPA